MFGGFEGGDTEHHVRNDQAYRQCTLDGLRGSGFGVIVASVFWPARARRMRGVQPSLLMRGLCTGRMAFVEHAMAALAGLSHQRMWLLMHDGGSVGLKAAFDRASLPPRLYPSFRAAVEVYHSIERESATHDRATFRKRMLERTLTLFQSVPKDDLDYLMDKLDASGAQSERAAG